MEHKCKSELGLETAPKGVNFYYYALRKELSEAVWETFIEHLMQRIREQCVSCRRKKHPKLRPLEESHFCKKFDHDISRAYVEFGSEIMMKMENDLEMHEEIEVKFLKNVDENLPWICPLEVAGLKPIEESWRTYFSKRERCGLGIVITMINDGMREFGFCF